MTFKHKLSARLARLWVGVTVLTVLPLASCEIPQRGGGGPIPPGAIDHLQLSPTSVTLAMSATTQFVAVGVTAAGDTAPTTVSWSVTGGALVQTVEDGPRHYGQYQAGQQPGSFRVIATAPAAEGGQRSDTATVLVTAIPVASVVVSPATMAFDVGDVMQFVATPQDANGNPLSGRAITWSSGSVAIATVGSTGSVTAIGAGSTTITATSEGHSGSASVTVTQIPVASVEVTPASANLAPGGVVQLTAVARDIDGSIVSGRSVAWSTSNAQVATVSAGRVTAVAVGSAQVVASVEGHSDTAMITVAVVPVASVEVTPATANLAVGSKLQLSAVAKDASGAILSGRTMTWSSSSAQIASVVAGLVTGVSAGTVQIAASVEGQSDTATITVTFSAVASVAVVPDATSVAVDGSYQFGVVLKDGAGNVLNGRAVAWSSSNSAVATVSASGMAHGVTAGSATITALSEGISGSASLTVFTQAPPGQCGAWPAGIASWVQPLPLSTGQAFYAAPSGSDAGPGTLAQPWKSLSKANSLQPGQILYLRAGTYGARGTTFNFDRDGTPSAPITLAGYPGDGRPIIQGRAIVSGTWLRVTGLIFDGPTGNVGGPGPNGEAVLVSVSGQHLELSNSEVRFDYWHAGVGGGGSVTDYRLINNYIHDNGGNNGDYLDDQNNTSHGIYNSPSSYGLVANNVIEHNDAKGISMRHDANHLLIVNNTIVGNGRFGISMVEQSHDIIAANNVVMNNGNMGKSGGGISMHDTGPYLNQNNVYWNNNNSNSASSNYPGDATVVNPLIADPLLMNPSDGTVTHQTVNPGTDNRLRAGSPAIGYADPNYALPFDITGKCRGSNPDAGAYQH